jgi:hypothetical protein
VGFVVYRVAGGHGALIPLTDPGFLPVSPDPPPLPPSLLTGVTDMRPFPPPSFSVTHVRGGGAARGRKTVLN